MNKDSFHDFLKCDVGYLQVVSDDIAVQEVSFLDKEPNSSKPNTVTARTTRQLEEYLEGSRKQFDLPLAPKGTTFQQKVWQELGKIPFGTSLSYLELAIRLGDEKVIRAAASANGKNPIAIIIPCHRVIGSDGSLTGYASGVHRKEWLLHLERHPNFTNTQLTIF